MKMATKELLPNCVEDTWTKTAAHTQFWHPRRWNTQGGQRPKGLTLLNPSTRSQRFSSGDWESSRDTPLANPLPSGLTRGEQLAAASSTDTASGLPFPFPTLTLPCTTTLRIPATPYSAPPTTKPVPPPLSIWPLESHAVWEPGPTLPLKEFSTEREPTDSLSFTKFQHSVTHQLCISLATWCEELTHLKGPWSWERLRVGGEGDDQRWDGWMASPTQWTWVWANSGRWWRTGKPGVLQSMGS